ncbi:DUF1178 family protein [Roseospira marina]|uniref:DUF1178 family protein n=1 Tax=Roseospira marina TaxID=140057 RepID=A0A5M6IA82_9PROT|nr:DUF1178 family protein [Roseospira marina]KAA5605184.1 DUF1178 family protein [Roseospira marina]MBB4314869.1 hypothetical protein [Roseospira marina]
MILYALRCDGGHEFEAWFRDAATFDRQAEAGVVRCPVCESARVGKAIMAPRLGRHHGARDVSGPTDQGPGAAGDAPASDAAAAAGPGPDAAPHTAHGQTPTATPEAMAEAVRTLRSFVERSCEDVGDRFAEEARRIHYGESDSRGIRGQATSEEAESLRDEGIEFGFVPWVRRTNA